MKTFLLSLLLIVNIYSTYSQTIRVGENAYKVQLLLEGKYGNQKKFDSYGNPYDIAEYLKKYNNGYISEVYVKEFDVPIIDLQFRSNIITKFFFSKDKLYRITKQFENIDITELSSRYREKYNNRKIDNYYFSQDFKNGELIKLVDNLASIEYFSVDNYNLSENVLSKVKQQQEIYSSNSSVRKNRYDTIKEIRFGYFNLIDYNKQYVDSIFPYITKHHVEATKRELLSFLKYNEKITKKEVLNECTIRFFNSDTRSYGNLESKERQYGLNFERIKLKKGNIIPSREIRNYLKKAVKIPAIIKTYEGKNYTVNSEFFYSYKTNIKRNEMSIKYKNNIKIIDDSILNDQERELIERLMKGKPKGYYKIMYQTGTVNNVDVSVAYSKKI